MIKIKNLEASIDDKTILKGIDLEIPAGEVHVIMGRNGSGKSTLANVIAGNEAYELDSGSISMNNTDITEMSIENRALEGIFLCFQYPVAIPGVGMAYFLRSALNAHRKHQVKDEMDALEFLNNAPICMRVAPSPSIHITFFLLEALKKPKAIDEAQPIPPTVKKSEVAEI